MNLSFQIQQELIEDFQLFEEWDQKYEYILDCAKNLKPIPQKYRKEEYLIKECQSKTWLVAEKNNNKIEYYADSESDFVKGLVAILLKIYSGNEANEILNIDTFFFEETEILKYLSPLRQKGLLGVKDRIKWYAKILINENKN